MKTMSLIKEAVNAIGKPAIAALGVCVSLLVAGTLMEPSVTVAGIMFTSTAIGIGGIALALYRQRQMAKILRGEK